VNDDLVNHNTRLRILLPSCKKIAGKIHVTVTMQKYDSNNNNKKMIKMREEEKPVLST